MEPINKFQPSTKTNNSNLNGSEIITGGSIIIPMDNKMLATTISMTRKGRKIKNPISKEVFNSLMAKAGINIFKGISFGSAGHLFLGQLDKKGDILLPGLFEHELFNGGLGPVKGLGQW